MVLLAHCAARWGEDDEQGGHFGSFIHLLDQGSKSIYVESLLTMADPLLYRFANLTHTTQLPLSLISGPSIRTRHLHKYSLPFHTAPLSESDVGKTTPLFPDPNLLNPCRVFVPTKR